MRGTSIVARCYQLSSTKVDAQSVINWTVVGHLVHGTCGGRPLVYRADRPRACLGDLQWRHVASAGANVQPRRHGQRPHARLQAERVRRQDQAALARTLQGIRILRSAAQSRYCTH